MRLRRRGLPPEARAGFVAGTATSFASTLASQALLRLVERDSALWPYAAYRAGLAGMVLARIWRQRRRTVAAYRQPQKAVSAASGNGGVASGNGSPTWAPTQTSPERRSG
jgi:hypothetical protein